VGNDQNKELLLVTRIVVDDAAVPPVCAFGLNDMMSPCKEDMDDLAQEMSSAWLTLALGQTRVILWYELTVIKHDEPYLSNMETTFHDRRVG
jgi:hypothetical protein